MAPRNYNQLLLDEISQSQRLIKAQPLILGGISGPGGGVGGPSGGFVGQLQQKRVTYDEDELATLYTPPTGLAPPSGRSLLDNLNHIRYRISTIEASSGILVVTDEDDSPFIDPTTKIVFVGGFSVSDLGNGIAEITIPPIQTIFTQDGEIFVGSKPLRIYNEYGVTRTISKVFLSVSIAPTGADIIVDVNINGSTIFSTQGNRPKITAGSNTGFTTTVNNPTWSDGSYLTIDIDQIGSTIPGSNITVHVVSN